MRTLAENGTTRVGGINNLRLSEDEKALMWENNAGERISRPADSLHVYLWNKLRAMTQQSEAAFEQIAAFISAEEAKKHDSGQDRNRS